MLTDNPGRFADESTGKLKLEYVLDGLLSDGLVEQVNADLLMSLSAGKSTSKSALQRIAESGWVTAKAPERAIDLDFLSRWLAEKIDKEWLHIDPLNIDVPEVTSVTSLAYSQRFNIICVEVGPDFVVFGTAEPFFDEWQREMEQMLKKEIRLVICNPADIERYLAEFYSLSKSVLGAKKDKAVQGQGSAVQNLEQMMELGRNGKLDANDSHVVSIVDWLLQYAYEQRASDIHLEPRRTDGIVRFRIDGVMQQVYEMPAAVMTAVTSRLKIVGRMDVAEKRRPQDGRLKTRNAEGKEVELRMSTMPIAFGEKMVMRIFNPDVLVKDQKALGFDQREADIWNGMIRQPNGIILVTGPTGSGKTTTLYSSLQMLATPDVNVCTIEDPIELVVPAFNQMQVQHNIDLDFASGVRTLLRQDPDIIMIGEIRDTETAQMAVQAALTGHLVLSTLHTNDAPSAVSRLLELGIPYYLIRSTLIGVIAQRLIRTFCPQCSVDADIDQERWSDLIKPWKSEAPGKIKEAVGCLHCRDSGFYGRAGIYELLQATPAFKQKIVANADVEELKKQAYLDGMRPLRVSGLKKVAQGLTDFEEILKVSPSPLAD